MDLNELQSVQSRERQTDSLQQLRATFYQDAADYIQDLERDRDGAAERADDPWNAPEVGRLNDDIDTAKGTVEAIYERRVGKIVKMASLAAADMPTDDEGLTEEEQALFDRLVTAIEHNREGVFAILDGEDPAIDPTDTGIETDAGSPASSDPGPASDPPSEPDPASGPPSESGPAETASSADPAAPPAEESPPGGADGHREVPPDVGQSEEEQEVEPTADPGPDPATDSGPDPTTGTPAGGAPDPGPDPDVGAADLMGGGSGDAQPQETNSRGVETEDAGPATGGSDAPDSVTERESSGASEAGQAVRDGGVEARAGESAQGPTEDVDAGHAETADAAEAADAGREGEADVDRSMVRITDDVGPIYGVEGREYELTADDVVTLPEANVGPLLKQGAAERLD